MCPHVGSNKKPSLESKNSISSNNFKRGWMAYSLVCLSTATPLCHSFVQTLILIISLNTQAGIKSWCASYSRGLWNPNGLNTLCQGKASARFCCNPLTWLQQIRSRKPAAHLLLGNVREVHWKTGMHKTNEITLLQMCDCSLACGKAVVIRDVSVADGAFSSTPLLGAGDIDDSWITPLSTINRWYFFFVLRDFLFEHVMVHLLAKWQPTAVFFPLLPPNICHIPAAFKT